MLLNRPIKRIGYGFKLKATNEQTRKTNENPLTQPQHGAYQRRWGWEG